jgi:twitching motility two-component system response regulator PilG
MSDGRPIDPSSHDAATVARPADSRPTFRVGVFGLGQKFQRIAEIILRHARHNRYRYVLALGPAAPNEFDIAMVDMTARGGPEVARTLRAARPVVRVGRRCDAARGQDDLLQSGFTMELLKTLNRVVEETLLGRERADDGAQAGMVVEGGVSRRARVLIVDDSPTVRRQLAMALQRMGVESDGAASAAQARAALAERRYDLAFVDVMMPDLDGFRFTRELKRHATLRAMPVVILTSRSSPLDLARGALAGCNSYLVKPVTLQSLRETLARHVRLNARIALERAGLRPA